MKIRNVFVSLLFISILFCQYGYGQVTKVKYQMRYNTTSCRFDCYLIIAQGSGTTPQQRAQFGSQFSVVVPTGSSVSIAQNFMPLVGNQSYNGTIPLTWTLSSLIQAPAVTPQFDYHGITPLTSPAAFYNNLNTGDTIRIFSLNISPITTCASSIHVFENNVDPPSDAPGMGGGDFSNGFALGGTAQLYDSNAPMVFPPKPNLSVTTACSRGVEIDLTATTSTCQSPLSYAWSGPAGYTGTTQDVAINPATQANAGLYTVTISDNRGCTSTTSITTVAKPSAGPDQTGCRGLNSTLTGTGPVSGTWSPLTANPSGATLGATNNGVASVSFDGTATGNYKFIYSIPGCSDTMNINIIVPNAGDDPAAVGCFSSGTATMSATGAGIWSLGSGSAGTLNIANPSSPTTNVSGFSAPGTYFLEWTVNGCKDVAQIVVSDNCTCTITNNLLQPVVPATYCGNSGLITVDGGNPSPAGGTFTWQYSLNNGAFAAASGTNNSEDYTTPDLGQGAHRYRRIYTLAGDPICFDTTNIVLFTVNPIPSTPANLTAEPNPVCLGNIVNLSVTNNPSATYTWTASGPNAGLVTSASNTTTMTPLATGTYSISVTQTVNGCASPAGVVSVTVSSTPPTPSMASITAVNPSTCNGSNGSITFSGLQPSSNFTLNYTKNSIQQFAFLTSNSSGVAILNAQSKGTYTNFSFTNGSGCISGVYAGPVTLTDPSAPSAPANLQADPNPTCANIAVNLSVTNNPGAVYNWTVSSPNAGLVPSTTNTATMVPTVSGFYNVDVTQTVGGCTSIPASIGISINNTPPTPTSLTVTRTNPTTCSAANGTISLSGLLALTAYDIKYVYNSNNITVNITTNASGVAIVTGLVSGSYSNFSVTNISGCTSGVYAGPVVLTDPSTPAVPANLTGVPNPVCLGASVNLSVTNTPGAVYTWTASPAGAGLAAGTTSTKVMTPTAVGVYAVSVTQTISGCTSLPATLNVTVNPTPSAPTAGTVTSINPNACSATNGSISLSGYIASTAYTLNYSKNGTPLSVSITSNSSGVIILANQSAGVFTAFSVRNASNCTSGVFAGPVNLVDPNAPSAPAGITAVPNPVCQNATVNLSVTNNPGAVYTWSASSTNAGLVTSTSNTTTMIPTVGGSYTINVTQTVAGCISPAASVVVVVNNGPATPTAASLTFTNPTVCAGTDGTISLSGLTPNGIFTINYTRNGNPLSANVTTNGAGITTINGLISGNYSGFRVTNAAGCSSGTYTGTVSLSDPGSPAPPASLAANPNPVCLGDLVNLSVTNNLGAVYTWGASSPNAGLVLSTTNSTTMLATVAGTYNISVFQTLAGCTSAASNISVVVHPIPPTLSAASVSGSDPVTCGGNDGSIIFSGLPNNATYTLTYSKNNVEVNTSITTSGTGGAVVTGLSAGNYTNFSLTGIGGCESNPFAGPVVLSDPGSPAAPAGLTALPNPVCFGSAVNLSVTNNPSATYAWTASSIQAGLVSSATNSTTMTALTSGNYVISVTQTIGGCTSPAATINVNINPLPPTPTAASVSSINPTICSGTDGTISFNGLPSNSSFTINYNRNNQAATATVTSNVSGVAILTGLNAGSYTDFRFTNSFGCNSGIYNGPIALTDPSSQPAPSGLTAVPNPSCVGSAVALTVTNNPSASYTWSASSQNAGLVASNTNQTSMLATVAGSYVVSVTQTVSGCTSPAAFITVVVEPIPNTPSANDFSFNNPTCGGSNGSILLSGLSANTTYTIEYSRNGFAVSTSLTTNGSGVVTINGLAQGTYSDFRVISATGCASGVYTGQVILSDPGLPLAPAGLVSDPTQICIRSTINLSVDNNPSATYAWSVSDIGAGLSFSNTSTTVMMPTSPGFYTVSVTQTVGGCTSPASTLVLEVKADCFNPDFDVTYVNVLLTGDVSTNDIPLPQKTYGAAIPRNGNPSSCLPVINADGTYTFTCGTPGKYNFVVPVCNGTSSIMCSNIPLVITVLQPLISNNPPIVNHDYARTKMDVAIEINILANDKCQSIPNCILNNPTVVTQPQHGTFNLNTFMYTPASGFVGVDSLRYSICQSPITLPSSCESAWIYITVISDVAPNVTNAMDDYAQTALNVPIVANAAIGVKWNDSDPEGDNQIITPMNVTFPGKGTINISSDGSYIFTPFTGYTGPVDCPYEVCDDNSNVACDIATLHILVEPFNPVGKVGNLVWHDTNGDGTQNAGEAGIPGVTVRLKRANGTLVATTTTNASGAYVFDNVATGSYYLQFVLPSQYSFTFANRSVNSTDSDVNGSNGIGTTSLFTIAAGEENLNIDAGAYLCSQVGDKVWYDINKNDVWNTNENGLNGIKVYLYRNHFGTWMVWDVKNTGPKPGSPSDDGYYQFCVPPGQYYVKVEIPEIELVQVRPNVGNNSLIDSDLTNANGKGTTNTFSLSSGQNKLDIGAGFYPMAVVGSLVWRDDNANGVQESFEPTVPGVMVQAFDANTNEKLAETVSELDGTYELDYLEKRDVYVKFDIPAGFTATVPGATSDDKDSDVNHSYGLNTTRKISLSPGMTVPNINVGIAFGVLPVKWVDVDVISKNNQHIISWSTASEVNVSHYEIERMLEGEKEFKTLNVKYLAKGDNNLVNYYNGTDIDIEKSGVYYYRIIQYDFDGKFTYSKTVFVSKQGENSIKMYPSPARNQTNLDITLMLNADVKIEMYDASARLIKTITNQEMEKGNHLLNIGLDDVQSGVYNLVIKVNEEVINKKLIKID